MKCSALLITAFAALLLAASCAREEQPYKGTYDDVFIYCGLGYNNLSSALKADVEELSEGAVPSISSSRAVLAYCHNLSASGGYSNPNQPVLIRLYTKNGTMVRDTIKSYPISTVSATPDAVHTALSDIKRMYPSRRYGMLFSSHATGWVPPGYRAGSEKSSWSRRAPASAVEEENGRIYPLTKSVGAQYYYEGSKTCSTEIDLLDFAAAIPIHLDYLIFDACLMGGAEAAWELRDVCDRLIFSPTEIISNGMVYSTLLKHLISGAKPELEAVCREYYEFYEAQSGYIQSATISLVDCSAVEKLAEAFADIVTSCRAGFDRLERTSVQAYFYDSKDWYYDLRDAAAKAGASEEQLGRLDSALANCVLYHAETEKFFDLRLERCCGLSVYLPDSCRPELNAYYRTLGWNSATGLVK